MRALLIVLLGTVAACAVAQPLQCVTRPPGDTSATCASDAFVANAVSGIIASAITALTGDVVATGPGSVTATIQPGVVTSTKMAAGAAATNVGTLGGVLTGTLPNPGMASGAAASNIGTLGGTVLSGTLPNPTLQTAAVQYTNIQFVSAARLLGNPGGVSTTVSEIPISSSFSFSGATLKLQAGAGDVSWPFDNIGNTVVGKVNGVTYPASPSTNTVPVVTGTNTVTYEAVPLAAGGTGDTGTAWSSFSASPACGSGTVATVTSRSKTLGKTTWIEADFTISTLGTCTTVLSFALPNTSNSKSMLAARDIAGPGFLGGCEVVSTAAVCVVTNAMSTSTELVIGGVYENQ
jgi:hypothetical protein